MQLVGLIKSFLWTDSAIPYPETIDRIQKYTMQKVEEIFKRSKDKTAKVNKELLQKRVIMNSIENIIITRIDWLFF